MTKNAASKKAAREYARTTGTSYIAARRLTRADDSRTGAARSVLVTYEFTGNDAPSAFQIDATWWLDELPWSMVFAIRESGWVHDPSGPDGLVPAPELLARVADQHPQLEAAQAWVVANTVAGYEETRMADPWAEGGERILAEPSTAHPYRMVFDAEAAQRWFDARGPLFHLELSDLVTPAERREWMGLHWPGEIDCPAGRHYFDGSPSPYMGECVSCGAMMLVKNTYEGDEYESIVDEDEFFAEAADTEAACNWAPPTTRLDGQTQSEWHKGNRRPFSWA